MCWNCWRQAHASGRQRGFRSQRVPPPCRSPVEADAEAIRAAVLLDEIMQSAPEQSTARIVVVCARAPR